MTTQYSSSVQKIVDASARCSEIGNAIGMTLLANGFDGMTAASKETMVTCFEASLEIMSGLVAWNAGDRSYESWETMFVKANSNEKWLAIDATGELAEISKDIIATGDLVGYFNEVVLPLDLTPVQASIDTITEVLEFIKSRVTID